MVVDVQLDYLFLALAQMLINEFVVLIDIVSAEVLDHHFEDVAFLDVLFLEALVFAFFLLMKCSL